MKFKKIVSVLLSVGILVSGIPLPVNASVSRQVWLIKEGMFPFNTSGSNQNPTINIDIPNLVGVTGQYTDNGVVNYSTSGSSVSVYLSGGNYTSTPVKGTATATDTFSFKTTDGSILKNVSNNRKVTQVLGYNFGGYVNSVSIDGNPNFLNFSLAPGSNRIEDTGNIQSGYDTVESTGNKTAAGSVNKSYTTLPNFSSVASVELSGNTNGSAAASISSDKKSVTYNFSGGTPEKQVERDGSGSLVFHEVTERGWVWLTQWFDGITRWYTTYYFDQNAGQQIIPYDTEIIPGNKYDSTQDDNGESIKNLLGGYPFYSDGIRRYFNFSSYVNSDWPYIAGYKLNTDPTKTIHTDARYTFDVNDGNPMDFPNTTADTVHYDPSGYSFDIFSDVHFRGDQIMSTKTGGATEDPRIEWHYQMEYGAGFSILLGRSAYNYKAQAKVNYYPFTYNYNGSVTYNYETDSTQTGYIYNGYIKAKYWSLETVQDNPPTPATSIMAGDNQITWLPSTDDYTPQANLRYDVFYKDKNTGSWIYLGTTTGTTSLAWTKAAYPTEGYIRIVSYDEVNQWAEGYNDPFAVLKLGGSLDKTLVTQDIDIYISANTHGSPKASSISTSMGFNNQYGWTSVGGSMAKSYFIPDETYSFFGEDSRVFNWGRRNYDNYGYTVITRTTTTPPDYYERTYGIRADYSLSLPFTSTNPANQSEYFKLGSQGTIIIPPLIHKYFDQATSSYKAEGVERWYSLQKSDGSYLDWLFGVEAENWPYDDYQDFLDYILYTSDYYPEDSQRPWPNVRYASLGKYYMKHMFGLDVPGNISIDPNLPISVTWDNGRVKLMQPGVVLASGISSLNFADYTLIASNYGNVENYANSPDYGNTPGYIFRFRERGEHVISKSVWSLDDFNTYYYNCMINVLWDQRRPAATGGDEPFTVDWTSITLPVPYLPGTDYWNGSIRIPHNIRNGNYTIQLTANNGSLAYLDLPIVVNTPINVEGTVPGTLEGGKTYTAEAYTSQYVDDGGVVMNIFGSSYTMAKSGGFGGYAAGKQKWICNFTVPSGLAPGNYFDDAGAHAKARFTATLPGGDSQSTTCKFAVVSPISSISGVSLSGYTGDNLAITATTFGYATSAWVEIPGVPSVTLSPSYSTGSSTNTWTGTFPVPFNFPNGTQNIVYKSSNSRGTGLTDTKTVTIGTKIEVSGTVKKPDYITWASSIPTGEKLDITVNVKTLPDIQSIEYSTPWFSGTIPLGLKTGSTTTSRLVTPSNMPNTVADGNYNVHIKVTTVNGTTAETDLPFTVYTPLAVAGNDVTTATDEDFKLSCGVTGVTPAISTVTAQVTGTLITTGGTVTNPTYTLTYNSITGRYESQALKLLMTSNTGSFPILYKAATTNGNVFTSTKALTVTTPLSITPGIEPGIVPAGGGVVVTARVNKWVKRATAAMPWGTIELDPALKVANGDGTYTYTQNITIPETQPDGVYNVVFTAYGYNNVTPITVNATLEVNTPLEITATVDPTTLPASETFTIDAWVDTPLSIQDVTYSLDGAYGGSGTMNFVDAAGTVSHYQATHTIDARHPDGGYTVNVSATLINGKNKTVGVPITISTPINPEPYINGVNTGCEIYIDQDNVLSMDTTRYVDRVEFYTPWGTFTSSSGQIQMSQDGDTKTWTTTIVPYLGSLNQDDTVYISFKGYTPSGRNETAVLPAIIQVRPQIISTELRRQSHRTGNIPTVNWLSVPRRSDYDFNLLDLPEGYIAAGRVLAVRVVAKGNITKTTFNFGHPDINFDESIKTLGKFDKWFNYFDALAKGDTSPYCRSDNNTAYDQMLKQYGIDPMIANDPMSPSSQEDLFSDYNPAAWPMDARNNTFEISSVDDKPFGANYTNYDVKAAVDDPTGKTKILTFYYPIPYSTKQTLKSWYWIYWNETHDTAAIREEDILKRIDDPYKLTVRLYSGTAYSEANISFDVWDSWINLINRNDDSLTYPRVDPVDLDVWEDTDGY